MSAQDKESFAVILGRHVTRRGYTYGQLARLSGLPKRTVAHWLEGIVKHPRDWRDLIKLSAVLHLDEAETSHLLQSAGHVSMDELLKQTRDETDCDLLLPWRESIQRRREQSPFQAVMDLAYFVGREHEMRVLKQTLLEAGETKLCSLHGMAGAGKTTLAAHLTYELRMHFPDGVLWARLDNSEPLSILGSFARAYGMDLSNYRDLESRSRMVRELLAHKRALIVLDNAETSDQVQPLLPPSGMCAVILTSRRHDLAVARGAQRFQIGPFERREDSLKLFTKILGREYVEREKEVLSEIAGLLGDLPLALDIAASRLAHEPGWSASEFLSRLQHEENRWGELVYENQSVQLSFNVSYAPLSAEQRDVFHSLGVFSDDFSPEAAAHVCGMEKNAAADQLRSLYALSLIQLGRPGRYRLHPLLRDLALKREGKFTAQQRMVAFFMDYADAQRENYEALDLETSNLLTALQYAFDLGLGADLIRGAGASCSYLDARGLYPQIELHLNRAIEAAADLGDHAAQADLLCKLGLALIHAGQLETAEQRLLAGLELTRQEETLEPIAALLLGYLGMAAYFRSDFAKMESYLRESLTLARTARQEAAICQLLDGLSEAVQRRGDYAAAEAYSREGLALACQLENPELICLLRKGLATVVFERGGDYAEVSACLEESLQSARDLGHPRVLCEALLTAGYILCEHGDYEAAETDLQAAFQLLQKVDFPLPRIFVLCTLGMTARGRRRFDQAAAYLTEGLALARQVGMTVLVAPTQLAWGWLHIDQGDWEAAARAFSEALQISRQTNVRVQIGQALFGLAQVAALRGDFESAQRHGAESLSILEGIGHRTQAEVREWMSRLDRPLA